MINLFILYGRLSLDTQDKAFFVSSGSIIKKAKIQQTMNFIEPRVSPHLFPLVMRIAQMFKTLKHLNIYAKTHWVHSTASTVTFCYSEIITLNIMHVDYQTNADMWLLYFFIRKMKPHFVEPYNLQPAGLCATRSCLALFCFVCVFIFFRVIIFQQIPKPI